MSIDLAGMSDTRHPHVGFRSSALRTRLGDLGRALRLHQWAKNLLIFVPLFLGHIYADADAWMRTLVGFVAFGLVASGTYLINDLVDLRSDRAHPTKRFRPIAAGRISPPEALATAAALVVAGTALAWRLSPSVFLIVGIYLVLTLAYSFRLKREPLVDVATISALFTLRVLAGAVLNGLTPSLWMLSFSAFLFLSLALAKRHAELMRCRARRETAIAGRGYAAEDWPLTLAFGVAAGLSSIVIMLLFVALEARITGAYRSPPYLLAAPACVSLWIMRIWLLSHRMSLDDDPVLFAFRDWVSYALGAIVLAGALLAI